VGFFTWLFGKKDVETAAPRPQEARRLPAGDNGPVQPSPASAARPERPPAPSGPEENLRRWRESGQPRAWVEAHRGQWNHTDWLDLLEELKRSPFWPLQPEAVGEVLEELKQEWLRRN
jgi:hypothetical protein